MPFTTRVNWKEEIPRIKELGLQGIKMSEIAREYGVSRQRILQVITKFIPDWKGKYGVSILTQQRADKHFQKWGHKTDTDLYREQRAKWRNKAANARRWDIPFELEFGDVEWPTHCPVLGIELNYFAEGVQENSVSFDRTDPSKGYVKGNVELMSRRANRIKNDSSIEELKKLVDYLTRTKK